MGVNIRQKEKDGPWWVFIAHKGKRKSKLVGDYDTARKVAKELRLGLAAGDLGLFEAQEEPVPQGPTFAEYAQQYLAKMEPDPRDPTHGLKRSTWNDYSLCVNKQLVPLLGEQPLAEIRRRDVKHLGVMLQERGLSPVNRRKHLRVLSSILSEAVDDELIPANPATTLRKHHRSKQGQAAHERIRPLTEEELTALLTTARAYRLTGAQAQLTRRNLAERKAGTVYPFRKHYPFLLLLARTGMRLSEAIALQWGDVDWRGRFIEIHRASVQGELSVPKNGKTRRVDLSDELYATLLPSCTLGSNDLIQNG